MYILDILCCTVICIVQLLKIFLIAILIQCLVYRLSNKKLSIYKEFRKFVMKEIKSKNIKEVQERRKKWKDG